MHNMRPPSRENVPLGIGFASLQLYSIEDLLSRSVGNYSGYQRTVGDLYRVERILSPLRRWQHASIIHTIEYIRLNRDTDNK